MQLELRKMAAFAKKLFITLVVAVLLINPAAAQSEHENTPAGKDQTNERFDPGDFIFEHVLDAYEWHIATINDQHISVSLPVILYSEHPELHGGKRFHVFMSSRFHHGHADYRGFRLSHSEKDNGKIVELDEKGNEMGRPLDLSITKTVAGIIVSVIVLFSLLFTAAHTASKNRNRAPSGIQNLIEPVIVFIRDEIAKPSIGKKHYKKFMPPLLTLFFFIPADDGCLNCHRIIHHPLHYLRLQ